MRWWTYAFALLTAALTLALALVVRENRRLREQLVSVVEAKARAAGLEPGSVLAPFALRDASGKEVVLDFAGEFLGTVFLFHASSCGASANTRPLWKSAIDAAARPDVRILCVQTDAVAGAHVDLEGLPASLAVPLPPVGWLAALPAVPATLVVDERGTLTRAWYRELDADAGQDLAKAIAALGTAPAPAR